MKEVSITEIEVDTEDTDLRVRGPATTMPDTSTSYEHITHEHTVENILRDPGIDTESTSINKIRQTIPRCRTTTIPTTPPLSSIYLALALSFHTTQIVITILT